MEMGETVPNYLEKVAIEKTGVGISEKIQSYQFEFR